jgi:hypothetical protein
MRAPSFRKATKGSRVSSFYSLPAPALGWNARDSIASMKEAEALIMDNVFPDTTDVMVRKGYSQFATGLSDSIESLMPYNRADGDDQLFCASNGAFYDVTAGGAVGAAVQSSLTNARWQHVNFTNSSGTVYLCCFNGVDAARYWNGSTWTTLGTSGPGLHINGGLDSSTVISAAVHKRRMWLVQVDSLKAWYLPVDSVGGSAAAIDLGGIAYKGGYIMALGTWTIDAGEGMDDYWCAVTSEGQLAVYRGTDPSSSTAWVLVGVWDVGQPIGRRCLYKYKSDLLYISLEGVLPLSAAITLGRTDQRVALTDKITQAMSSAAASNKSNFGWELLFYPEANMLMLNVPIDEGMNQEQYAMNTVTGAWGGPFNGIEANCWCIFGGEPYFGSDGYVGKFWDSLSDNGNNIEFEAQQAYTYLGTRGRLKQVKSVRPYILAGGNFSVVMGVNVDFSQSQITGSISFSAPTYGIWDTGLWDFGIWGADLNSYADWQTVNAIGTAVSLRIKGQVKNIEFRYAAADVVYENGGVIA